MKRSFSLFANLFGSSATPTTTPPAPSAALASVHGAVESRLPERQHIVPIIKSRSWLAESRHTPADNTQPFDFLTEEFNAEMVVVYVEDQNKILRYLNAAQLAALGVKRQDLRALALENLMRLLPQIQLHSAGPVSMLTAGGNYEASLLLVKDFWGGGKVQVAGEIVVAVPSRDVVLITGSGNPDGLAQLKKLARASRPAKASFQLTQSLFVYRDGQFLPWSA